MVVASSRSNVGADLKAEVDALKARQKRLWVVAGSIGGGAVAVLIGSVKMIKTMDDREDQRAVAMVVGVLLICALAAAAISAGLALTMKLRISAKEAEAHAQADAAWAQKKQR